MGRWGIGAFFGVDGLPPIPDVGRKHGPIPVSSPTRERIRRKDKRPEHGTCLDRLKRESVTLTAALLLRRVQRAPGLVGAVTEQIEKQSVRSGMGSQVLTDAERVQDDAARTKLVDGEHQAR